MTNQSPFGPFGPGNMRLGDPEFLDLPDGIGIRVSGVGSIGGLPPMIAQMLGIGASSTHSQLCHDEMSFGRFHFHVMHPIFGDIDISGTENDTLRAIAAILIEVDLHGNERYEVLKQAIEARENAAERNSAQRLIANLRREPAPPDDDTVANIEGELKVIDTTLETLVMGFYFVKMGFDDGTLFDRLVDHLDVADMLGHTIEPLLTEHAVDADIVTDVADGIDLDKDREVPVGADV